MTVGHLPKPLFIPEHGRPKTLDIEVGRGPGVMDMTIHMTDTDTGAKLGVLVISRLWLHPGNDEAGG
jgi:hypothetical protein